MDIANKSYDISTVKKILTNKHDIEDYIINLSSTDLEKGSEEKNIKIRSIIKAFKLIDFIHEEDA